MEFSMQAVMKFEMRRRDAGEKLQQARRQEGLSLLRRRYESGGASPWEVLHARHPNN